MKVKSSLLIATALFFGCNVWSQLSLADLSPTQSGLFIRNPISNQGFDCPNELDIRVNVAARSVLTLPDAFGLMSPVTEGTFCEEDRPNFPSVFGQQRKVRHCQVLTMIPNGFRRQSIREEETAFGGFRTVGTETADFTYSTRDARILTIRRYGDASNSPNFECTLTPAPPGYRR